MTNDLKTITNDLERLDKEIGDAEKEKVQAEAQRDLLLKQGEKEGIVDIESAKQEEKNNEIKLEKLNEKIIKEYETLKSLYEW